MPIAPGKRRVTRWQLSAAPPSMPKRNSNITVIPGSVPESERISRDILERKRLNHMAKYGIPMPDGSRARIDMCPLDMARRVAERMKNET